MSLTEDVVPSGEPVLMSARKHPFSQAGAVLLSGAFALAGGLLEAGGSTMDGLLPSLSSAWQRLDLVCGMQLPQAAENLAGRPLTFGLVVGPLALLCAAGVLYWGMMTFRRTVFVVTPRRVLVASGVVGREVDEITVNRIRGVVMRTGFLGGVFGYGNILVLGLGNEYLFMRMVRQPLGMLRAIEGVQV